VRPLAVPLVAALLLLPATPAVAADDVLTIGAVQGPTTDAENPRTDKSPLTGQLQVRGVITQRTLARSSAGADQNGFFLQSRPGTEDGDPTSSDGIFVFMSTFGDLIGGYVPVVGDEVVLKARVSEYFTMTQLSSASLVTKLDANVAVPPTEARPPSDAASADRFWERHEGMQLRVRDGAAVVSGRNVFGSTADAETWVVDRDDPLLSRPDPFARRTFRDAHPLDGVADRNGNRILLGSMGVKATAKDSGAMLPAAHTFDTLAGDAVGGLYYAFNKYAVQPASAAFTAGDDPSANRPPKPANRDTELAISTYNVENLYDFRDDPFDGCDFLGNAGCTGVSPPFDYVPASQQEYDAQLGALAEQIVTDLHAPDLILVQEAEDQDICAVAGATLACGATNNADGAPDSLQELALTVASRGGPAYAAAYDRTGADARGITAAFLYRTDRLALAAPASVLTATPGVAYRSAALPSNAEVSNPKTLNAVRPSDMDTSTGVDGPNVFTRAPQVARFTVRVPDPYDLWAVSNHYSSGPDSRIGQRREQARYGAAIVQAIEAAAPGARIAYGGDLNVFPRPDDPVAGSDQLAPLYDAHLHNLWQDLAKDAPASAYSYVFDGQAQTLDHLFVTDSLYGDLVEMRAAHVNADWAAENAADGSRGSSDHDPQVARFRTRVSLSVADATAAENTGRLDFRVSLSRPVDRPVPACGFTLGLTALPWSDFDPWAGCVSIPAGSTSVTVPVRVRGDSRREGDEQLLLTVLAPVHLADPVGRGTITNDD
jgi:predicted extracellular nuclease